uniref:Phosphorylated adapter RNA export protein n=1 Tax=Chromera velia CCMP2878 TaxID=1169474 RepID=A0A0G4HBC8_9ALVE|eukprot:Cvel_6181.t1-p1 / transcript=Cvel_6181.t1 / gene=Cvel_6181 / organism=Chromera_velia_CCMP2878 / gene_product=Phosphorylated adapter RNA export protein, putative / transcript_product=Phosphorylated adapter RNA export protein, putative / location=Cvel_scaffold299:53474-55846(-) / protein_length=362 / sequence_SO=supercontig / SO=protein_coding / is_pseudo=false
MIRSVEGVPESERLELVRLLQEVLKMTETIQLTLSPEEASLCAEMIYRLREKNVELFVRVVHQAGTELCRNLFQQTLTIEENGGMFIEGKPKKRTPGGVFIVLLKQCLSADAINVIWRSQKDTVNKQKSQMKIQKKREEREREERLTALLEGTSDPQSASSQGMREKIPQRPSREPSRRRIGGAASSRDRQGGGFRSSVSSTASNSKRRFCDTVASTSVSPSPLPSPSGGDPLLRSALSGGTMRENKNAQEKEGWEEEGKSQSSSRAPSQGAAKQRRLESYADLDSDHEEEKGGDENEEEFVWADNAQAAIQIVDGGGKSEDSDDDPEFDEKFLAALRRPPLKAAAGNASQQGEADETVVDI